ncbi:Rap1a/Tai family immunity protein [Bradyrhizobium sp. LMTR 3]|uniref:Rap1a/Tai family immunity protein n=1 Tax=Bradyrhizobium sp. LMTR 3 TaxID=189873 RepID=UPI001FDAC20B|nr:Rap1a/Tai family immunity protein [Bradyrhizobium sp. LMTR 3]
MPAMAEFDSGNDLYRFCNSNDGFEKGLCYGLISGHFDNLHLAYQCKHSSAPNISRQQVVDIVMQALRQNPQERHLPAYLLSSRAMIRAFDCESWVGSGPAKR